MLKGGNEWIGFGSTFSKVDYKKKGKGVVCEK